MITGFHALIFSADAAADRAFLRDVLGFPYVDDGEEWLIFKLPPAEIGVHPFRPQMTQPQMTQPQMTQPQMTESAQSFALMVDDIAATVADLRSKSVIVTDPVDRGFGLVATLSLPSGALLDVYEPRHATAKDM